MSTCEQNPNHGVRSVQQSTCMKLWSCCHQSLSTAGDSVITGKRGHSPPQSVCRLPSHSSSLSASPVSQWQWRHSDSTTTAKRAGI